MIKVRALPHRRGAFYSWLSKRPCVGRDCQAKGVHLHHIAHADLPRRGHALSEFTVLPLCPHHHADGPHAAHRMKQSRFLQHHGIDLDATLLAQYQGYAVAHGLSLPPGLSARQAAEWLVSVPGYTT